MSTDGNRRRWLGGSIVAMMVVFLAVGLVQAWRDSPTVDEAVDIASGITSLDRHDLRLGPEHDLLIHVLPTGPALLARPIIPNGAGYRSGDWFLHTDEFMRANRRVGKIREIVFLARLIPLGEGLAVAGLLFALGAELFDRRAGALASFLWLSTPVFVGFSHLVSIDITFTLTTLGLTLAIARYRRCLSARALCVVAAALGASMLARHNGVLLVPAAALAVATSGAPGGVRRGLRDAASVCVMSWAVVWTGMLAFGADPRVFSASRFDGLIAVGRAHSVLARLSLAIPWPKEWAAGLAYLATTSGPRPAYLVGRSWIGGQWWFFPVSVLVKTPFAVVVLLSLAPLGWIGMAPCSRRRAAWTLLPLLVVLGGQLLIQPLDLGLRYGFPVVALLLVATGPIVSATRSNTGRVGIAVLVMTQAVALVAGQPHSLAWTPRPFTPAYRWASDSNVDYGQDEYAVERWAKGKDPFVALLLPRGVDAPAGSRRLVGADPATVKGWVAVSATRLTVLDHGALSWLRGFCPVATIGGSVLIYRFDQPPDARPGPEMPVGLCAAPPSRRRS